jgi:hypothetical protein
MSYQSQFDPEVFYESEGARAEHDRKASLRLANAEREKFDGLSAEAVRSLYEQGLRDQESRAGELRSERTGQVWVSAHPEFVQCAENAAQVQNYLELTGRSEQNVRYEDLEAAYEHLNARGLLRLDAEKSKQMHAAEIAEEGQEIRRRRSASSLPRRVSNITRESRPSYSEDDLMNMPYEDLARLARAAYAEGEE